VIPTFVKRTAAYQSLRLALEKRLNPNAGNPFLEKYPPGHFHSPLPDLETVDRAKTRLFDRTVAAIPGLDTNVPAQLALLNELAVFYPELPFTPTKSDGLRYYFENPYFGHADALVLYSMLRHYRPRRVIEVGSGFSSAVMLDTNDLFLSGEVRFTFIEPYPDRLLSLLSDHDKRQHELIGTSVQEIPLNTFDALQAHDVLFVDSSHVAKIGSDVVHLLTDVLPRLVPGVIIHFHDVLWPFEYPEEWLREGRAWNECYVLRAFLQYNASFKILLFNSYLGIHHRGVLQRGWPLSLKDTGGSLWITKT
jgi:predicted O-methyltransferase YrrM